MRKNPCKVFIHKNHGTSNVANVCPLYCSNSKGLFEVLKNTILGISENHSGNLKMESKAWTAAINAGQVGGERHDAALRENS